MDGIKRPSSGTPQKKSVVAPAPTQKRIVAPAPPISARPAQPIKPPALPMRASATPVRPSNSPRASASARVQSMLPPVEHAHPSLSAPQKKEVIAEQYFSKKTSTTPSVLSAETDTPKRKGPRTSVLIGLAFIAVVIGGFLAMSTFGAMVVEVTPREQLFKLEKPAVFDLAGSKVSTEKTVSVSRTATQKQPVKSAASGRIKIVNNYSTDTQSLAASTRFAAPSGNIYRIKTAVTVPAAKKENGKIVSSSIEVTIYADQPGTAYNLTETTKFTIPGFQGGLKYTGFYGESIGVIDGGFIGESGIVADADVTAAEGELKKQLNDELIKELNASGTEGFTLVPFGAPTLGAAVAEPAVGKPAESFTVKMTGSLSGVLVRTEELNSKLEEILFEDFPAEKNHLETLSFEGFSVVNFSESKQASIQLSNSIRIAVFPEVTQLVEDIQKSSVGKIKDVFSSYSAIESADVRFTPSWWRRIPSRSSRIKVEVLKP